MLRINMYSLLLCLHSLDFLLFASAGGEGEIENKQIRKRGLIDRREDVPLAFKELVDGYRIYQKRLSWKDALAFCASCGMSFATFETKEIAWKVRDSIYNLSVYTGRSYDNSKEHFEFGLDRRYWFGLKESEENNYTYHWIKTENDKEEANFEEFKSLWWPDQPDHLGSDGLPEHCIGFWNPNYYFDTNRPDPISGAVVAKHSFNDSPCNYKYYYICRVEDGKTPKEITDCKLPDKKDSIE